MNTKVTTLSLVVSICGALAIGACDSANKAAPGDKGAKAEGGKDAAAAGVQAKDGAGAGAEVKDGSITAKSDGNEVEIKADPHGAVIEAKAADGTEAVIKADAHGAEVQGDGGVVKADNEGNSVVEKGDDKVETDAAGNTNIKSGNTDVKVGKDGKVEISGVPGL
jgi:hypothetical protein